MRGPFNYEMYVEGWWLLSAKGNRYHIKLRGRRNWIILMIACQNVTHFLQSIISKQRTKRRLYCYYTESSSHVFFYTGLDNISPAHVLALRVPLLFFVQPAVCIKHILLLMAQMLLLLDSAGVVVLLQRSFTTTMKRAKNGCLCVDFWP